MYKWLFSMALSFTLLGALLAIGIGYGFFIATANIEKVILGTIIFCQMSMLLYEWIYARKELREKILKEINTKSKEN